MLRVALSLVFASAAMFGQSVISAKAGLVNYHDGDVQIAGEPIQSKPSQFTSLKVGQELRTGLGRAEILMTPGVFLRLGENSAIRMISNSLTEPKVALIEGSALVACMDMVKDTPIMVSYGDRSAYLTKNGLYRFDANSTAASLRVYEGEAKVGETDVKKGRELSMSSFGETKEIAKFDTKDTDELYRWASRRDQYISMANVSAARTATSGFGSGGYGYTGYPGASIGCGNSYFGAYSGYFGQRGGWRFNPCFGMFTYVPYNGIFTSPFGWNYFSPSQVVYLYYPQYSRGIGNGISGGGSSSVGFTRSYDATRGYDVMSSRGSFGSMSGGGSAGFPAASGSAGAVSAAGSARSGGDAGGRGSSSAGGGRGH